MKGLRVAELAERARIAPSTVRFYERAGLLSPAQRADNGYRVFGESALDELAFITRAKSIGMSLEDIAGLVAAWPTGECRSLQARMRDFLARRISQVREQQATRLVATQAPGRGRGAGSAGHRALRTLLNAARSDRPTLASTIMAFSSGKTGRYTGQPFPGGTPTAGQHRRRLRRGTHDPALVTRRHTAPGVARLDACGKATSSPRAAA